MDLQVGDTGSYYCWAAMWRKHWRFENPQLLIFSPLYIMFYGVVQSNFADAYAATIIHRIVIVLALALALLSLLRVILPVKWAWLITAWWLVLPGNSLACYEVHPFGFLILVVGCWLAGAGTSRWFRGSAVAVLLVAALGARNEFLPTVVLFAIACIWFEIKKSGSEGSLDSFKKVWLPLFLPMGLMLVCVCAAVFKNHQQIGWKQISEAFEKRHKGNMTQVYAFGYKQRHADWKRNPWTDGMDLVKRDFGQSHVTFREAFRANPKAMAEHVKWNLTLVPAGLQLALFGYFSGNAFPILAHLQAIRCGR
jgi:hypothetical protein